jgi:hypothetical protein
LNEEQIKKVLEEYKKGTLSLEETLMKFKGLPFEDMGFAKVDHHRPLRKGFPEVVYCPGKTIEQITKIYQSLYEKNKTILLTRANEETYQKLLKLDKELKFEPLSRSIYRKGTKKESLGELLVICAGTADIPVAEEAAITAELMGAEVKRIYDVGVAGLHRLLRYKEELFEASAIVVIAGMEGALPSVVAGLTACPIIATPTSVGYGANLNGISALLTMLNSCAPNVAVVNINNGFGAGLMGALILRQKKR